MWGGSYGGYMVLAGVSMQPRLWAAGVDIVGISSLVTFLENTSGYRRAHRELEYGSLAEDRDFLLAASPLVERVTGQYYEDCQVAAAHTPGVRRGVAAYAMDPEKAARLWNLSLDLLNQRGQAG